MQVARDLDAGTHCLRVGFETTGDKIAPHDVGEVVGQREQLALLLEGRASTVGGEGSRERALDCMLEGDARGQ